MNNEKLLLIEKVNNIEKKNDLLSKNLNHDLVDILVREKFMYGKKNEVLIKIND